MNTSHCWSAKNFQNLIKSISSHYSSELSAFYEFLKNIQDQPRSTDMFIDINYDRKSIIIYGNGEGADDKDMTQIMQSIGVSSKDAEHQGLGLQAFIKFAQKLVFIGKKDGECYIVSAACSPNGQDIVSETGAPHVLAQSDREYGHYTHLIQKYKEGTVYILEGVGVPSQTTTNVQSSFDINKIFNRKEVHDFIRKMFRFDLSDFRIHIKSRDKGKEVIERVKPKMGVGTKYPFSVPSKDLPYPKERTIFTLGGSRFELSLKCELWISDHKQDDGIFITQKHRNALTIDDAYGSCQKLHRSTSIFRNNSLGQYLTGEISFSVFPLDQAEPPCLYTGARNQLLLNTSFGDALTNMLYFIDTEYMREKLKEHAEKLLNKMDAKLNKEYEDLFSDFFRAHPDLYNSIGAHLGSVSGEIQMRTCPSCKSSFKLETMNYFPDNNSPSINRVFRVGDIYICGKCKHQWQMDRRTFEETPQAPISSGTPPEGKEKLREKRHGKGYNIHLIPLPPAQADQRSTYRAPSTIIINTHHTEYKQLSESIKASPNKKLGLKLRNASLIVHEIIAHNFKDSPVEHLARHTEMFSQLCGYMINEPKNNNSREDV